MSSVTTESMGVYGAKGPEAEALLKKATGPMKRKDYFATVGSASGPKQRIYLGGQNIPTLTGQSVIQAMAADRAATERAAADQVAREKMGRGKVEEALTKTTGGLRETAEQMPARVSDITSEALTRQAPGIAEAKEASRALTAGAEERRTENVEVAEAERTAAMERYEDTTAAQIQSYRLGESRNLQGRLDQITAEAQQRGVDPSDPSVMQAQQLEKDKSADRLGQYVAQVSVSYNQNLSSLGLAYDQLVTGVRQAESGMALRGAESGLQSLLESQRLEDSFSQMAVRERTVAEQTRAQLLTMADQMELQGNQWLAEWLRDESVFTSPLAPLIATAFAWQQSQAGGRIGGLTVNQPGTTMTPSRELGTTYPPAGIGYGKPVPLKPAKAAAAKPTPSTGPAGDYISPEGRAARGI